MKTVKFMSLDFPEETFLASFIIYYNTSIFTPRTPGGQALLYAETVSSF